MNHNRYYRKLFQRGKRVHGSIGERLAAYGGVLRCKCGREEPVGSGQTISSYLLNGWPRHCNQTMTWVTELQLVDVKRHSANCDGSAR